MSTATKTWDKKAIYHSELVRASQGGLAVMFTGKPRDSKYPGKPRFVGFKVYGDESEYTLNIENQGCEDAIAACPEKVWVVVRADGARDDAWISVTDANGNPVIGGVPAEEIAQPQNGPPPNWPDSPKVEHVNAPNVLNRPAHPVSTNADVSVQRAAAMTIQAVAVLRGAGIPVDGDAAARIYNTHFIQASR